MALIMYKFIHLIMEGCELLYIQQQPKLVRGHGDRSYSVLLSLANILSELFWLCHLLPDLCRWIKVCWYHSTYTHCGPQVMATTKYGNQYYGGPAIRSVHSSFQARFTGLKLGFVAQFADQDPIQCLFHSLVRRSIRSSVQSSVRTSIHCSIHKFEARFVARLVARFVARFIPRFVARFTSLKLDSQTYIATSVQRSIRI